ncbi:MAG TPA: sigma-54 dependent transcriptional regulator [Caulobacteraceae bacterium]
MNQPHQAPPAILVVDDDADVLQSVRMLLSREAMTVSTAAGPAEALSRLTAESFDVVLLDLNFSRGATAGDEGLGCLQDILGHDPDAVVVVVTGHSGVNIAVSAMRAGASDFVTKPWSNERLVATVTMAVELRRRRRQARAFQAENNALVRDAYPEAVLLGSSPVMSRLRDLIARAGPTEANVLILGEHGSGKELVARALHLASSRGPGPFIPVDLAALPEARFEAELFGERGLGEDRPGRLVAAHGGTLFLDEIGNLPLPLQVKLLSAIERRQVTPVGGDKPVPLNARIVAATNLTRAHLYSEAVFRADLLYRLNTVELNVPPLRDRGDDIVELARHYLRHYARRYGRSEKKALSEATAVALRADAWPGNVRALRHAMERAVILSEGAAYEVHDFVLTGPAARTRGRGAPAAPDDLNLERSERTKIVQALQKHHYNVSHAARDLGLTRAALYRRMEKHGL